MFGSVNDNDGRNLVVRHVGTVSPEVEYGRRLDVPDGAGDGAGKTEHEILADLVTSARHDADGTRIITLNIDNDCRQWELFQRGRTTSRSSSRAVNCSCRISSWTHWPTSSTRTISRALATSAGRA
jgi:hypothetical protein